MARRPSFQFYPADWKGNAKLRRCSEAARGAWMDIMGTLHDSDEYGVCRWPLVDLARAAGVALKLAKELAAKDVLKGSDKEFSGHQHTPTHAGKKGEPVTLIAACTGPVWFSSRMVRDEWRRSVSGGATRFTADDQPDSKPNHTPSARHGECLGDGSSTSSSSTDVSSLRSDTKPPPKALLPDWLPEDPWLGFLEMRKRIRATVTARGQTLLIGTLEKLRAKGHDPTEVLNQSVMNSWKGLFPLKSENANGTNNRNGHSKPNALENNLRGLAIAAGLAGPDTGDEGADCDAPRETGGRVLVAGHVAGTDEVEIPEFLRRPARVQ